MFNAKWICILSVVGLIGLGSKPAQAGYKLQPGDVLEVSVVGLPEFRQKSTVNLDGEVTLPMIATVKVAGLELSAAQEIVKQQMSRKLYQQRGPDGRDFTTAIAPDTVTLLIATHRPIYLNGDVTKPGQQTYEPGMTVRQAV